MEEKVSSKLPKTDAESKLLEDAIAELLQQIPESWDDCDANSLTETQEKARFLLVAAGMVERRGSFSLRMFNHSVTVEAKWSATGEAGFSEAVNSVAEAMWSEWSEPWHVWQESNPGNGHPFHVQVLTEDEWRLTDQGVIARSDIENDELRQVWSFVLKQGINAYRDPVAGSGSLIHFDKKTETPATTNIGNWNDGANAFADAFGPMFEKAFEAMANRADSAEYSKPNSPEYWREVFAKNGQAISQNTFKRMIERDEIRVHPSHTTKSYRIDKRDLPDDYEGG